MSRGDFTFDKARNVYICPQGKLLHTTGYVHDGTTLLYRARVSDCGPCPLKPRCCPKTPERKIPRSIHEDARDLARALVGTPAFEQSLALEQITPGSTEASSQVLRVKDSGADVVIVVGGSIPDLANYIKAHKLFENPAPLIGNSLFTAGGFLKLAGNAAEGFVYPDAIDPSRNEIQEIDAKLVKAYGERLKGQAVALQAWECMRLVCDAIRRAGSEDREKI